ncbi:MAG: single-stranded-DNA-specific exonuclease RecJ [Gemmatimonadota bacterium]|nr:single-stranded-DNA-specific exonuclease RecJ [Gemmatimonadota bacterium]
MNAPQLPRRRGAARWRQAAPPDAAIVRALQDALSLPAPLCALLAVRGFGAPDAARRYLRPQLDQLQGPEALKDLDVAVARLQRALTAGEMIVVHGDYDVDGMCSTTLMVRTLRALGGNVTPFIPNRMTDGYDLGPAGVQAALDARASVVLTCDCGTSAHASVQALQDAGVDVIISDHHLPGGPLPAAHAVLNPRRPDDTSPDKDLAAVGVAFKLAMALTRAMGGNENVVLNMLDLVALATVADVAPLRGENRVFTRLGLAMMRDSRSLGLRALLRAAELDKGEISAGRVSFQIAPRLNALGRIGRAADGVRLLLSDREDEANQLARQCEEMNRERQAINQRMLDEATARLDAMDMTDTWGVVLHDAAWHPGVIGIVASRLVEQTGRPTFMIAVQDGVGKGSGRSIPAFDLHAALQSCGDLLMKHGGHRAAAGLTIDPARLGDFAARFNDVARSGLTPDDLLPELRLDLELPLDEATVELATMLRHVEPCGIGNAGPTFHARGVRMTGPPERLKTEHMKLRLATARGPVEALGWGMAYRIAELQGARQGTLEIAYKLELNTFRQSTSVQAVLQDVRVEERDGRGAP